MLLPDAAVAASRRPSAAKLAETVLRSSRSPWRRAGKDARSGGAGNGGEFLLVNNDVHHAQVMHDACTMHMLSKLSGLNG
jgi:hypothetical protein